MARIPAAQRLGRDRERLRDARGALQARRLRPGRGGRAPGRGDQALARRPRRSPSGRSGCFLFTGPTGVGKTELAKQLARCSATSSSAST